MNNITIEKPKISDINNLIKLWEGQYLYHNNLDSTYYVENSDKLKNKFRMYLKKAIEKNDPNILIAKKDENILGFITFEENKENYFDTKIIKFGLVIELFVSEKYRNQGVGKALMEKAEKYFKNKGLNNLKLQCSSFNKNALGFYDRMGYIDRQRYLFKKINPKSS